jgi:hypothetical protein
MTILRKNEPSDVDVDVVDVDVVVVVNGENSTEDNDNDHQQHLQHPISTATTIQQRRTSATAILKRFSLFASTEDYHSESDRNAIYGPYRHIRKMILDKSSHYMNYTEQRSWLQDAIVEDLLDNVEDRSRCITPTQPWLIFTVGARGCGKNHTLHELVNTQRLPILSFVHVDPDGIRRRLPEFESYAAKSSADASQFLGKESSFMAELLLLAALQNGRNVVFDSAIRHPEWFVRLIKKMKQSCATQAFGMTSVPKVALLHITAPKELIFERAKVSIVCVPYKDYYYSFIHSFHRVSPKQVFVAHIIHCRKSH